MALVTGLASCAATPTPRLQVLGPDILPRDYLPLIEDGKTTREQVVLKLGAPSAEFENQRILTYVLLLDAEDRERVEAGVEPTQPACSLVFVFGANNVLERHSIVGGK